MNNVREEVLVWIRLGGFVVIWVAVLFTSGVKLSINWEAVRKLPEVVTIYVILSFVFTTWLWRLRLFQGWLVPYPDIQGTWAGTLQSTWEDPSTGQPKPPFPILIVIKQSFSCVSCAMYTRESTSY